MKVAVLCCARRSHYKYMRDVEAYDVARDARSWAGGMPVVAHPPCRCWSRNLARFAKPLDRDAEMALGVWCVEQVRRWGGVVEQPAHSRLWEFCGLPLPGARPSDPFGYSLYVEQGWFGFATRKPTWLYVSGVPSSYVPEIPFAFERPWGPKLEQLSRASASRTVPVFGHWLCDVARQSWFVHGC